MARRLLGLVRDFDASTPREMASQDRFLSELDRLSDPFDRDSSLVHVTGSAIVAGPVGTVLHLHKRLGIWIQPGGHLEVGEEPFEAALREAEEETGLALQHPSDGPFLLHLDVHPAAEGHTHLDLRYLLLSDGSEPAPPAGESQHVRWFSLEEAISITDEALVGGLVRLRRLLEARSDLLSSLRTSR